MCQNKKYTYFGEKKSKKKCRNISSNCLSDQVMNSSGLIFPFQLYCWGNQPGGVGGGLKLGTSLKSLCILKRSRTNPLKLYRALSIHSQAEADNLGRFLYNREKKNKVVILNSTYVGWLLVPNRYVAKDNGGNSWVLVSSI